jgi:ABC-type dipeptide/oligopeptide/nickel transport system permease component
MLRKLEYVIRRIAMSLLVLVGLSIITFALARVIPSDPAALYIGPHPNPGDLERTREKLGLNRPVPVQYAYYLGDMLRGDWGDSIATKRPVLQEIGDRWAATLELLLTAMTLAVLIGIPLGVFSARLQGSPFDLAVRTGSIVGVSVPAFWLGLLLQIVFFRNLHLLPLAGRLDTDLRFTNPIESLTGFYLLDTVFTGNWIAFQDAALHIVLPALTLAAYPIGLIARMTRATMLEVLSQDYIRTARAYGTPEPFITYVYALKNAIGPTLTVIGLTLAYALTGTFFVEIVFNWPGLGLLTVHSLLNVDYPVIMGITLFAASGYVIINLMVDLAQAWIDPRISLG